MGTDADGIRGPGPGTRGFKGSRFKVQGSTFKVQRFKVQSAAFEVPRAVNSGHSSTAASTPPSGDSRIPSPGSRPRVPGAGGPQRSASPASALNVSEPGP